MIASLRIPLALQTSRRTEGRPARGRSRVKKMRSPRGAGRTCPPARIDSFSPEGAADVSAQHRRADGEQRTGEQPEDEHSEAVDTANKWSRIHFLILAISWTDSPPLPSPMNSACSISRLHCGARRMAESAALLLTISCPRPRSGSGY